MAAVGMVDDQALGDINLRIALRMIADGVMDRGDTLVGSILEVAIRTIDDRVGHADAVVSGPHAGVLATATVRRNVRIDGRRTSIMMEQDFWDALDRIAKGRNATVDAVCSAINRFSDGANLTAAIRVYILRSICGSSGALQCL
jgi:predicted DNA-binding ribbon-helix-helix protein